MSKPDDLSALLEVSDLLYARQRQALVAILQEEAVLRRELVRLSEMGGADHEDTAELSGMKVIGADLLWNGWLARAKTDANIRLAQVLARKDFEQNRVRKAFGKVTALQQIISDQQKEAKRAAAKATLGQAIDLTVTHR